MSKNFDKNRYGRPSWMEQFGRKANKMHGRPTEDEWREAMRNVPTQGGFNVGELKELFDGRGRNMGRSEMTYKQLKQTLEALLDAGMDVPTLEEVARRRGIKPPIEDVNTDVHGRTTSYRRPGMNIKIEYPNHSMVELTPEPLRITTANDDREWIIPRVRQYIVEHIDSFNHATRNDLEREDIYQGDDSYESFKTEVGMVFMREHQMEYHDHILTLQFSQEERQAKSYLQLEYDRNLKYDGRFNDKEKDIIEDIYLLVDMIDFIKATEPNYKA